MPKQNGEEHWQYMGHMVDLAARILAWAKRQQDAQAQKRMLWYFGTVSCELNVERADVEAACRTLGFTHECHVRDDFFFLRTKEEKDDDLQWMTGTGRFAQ